MKQEQRSIIERGQVALKEEKVLVTSGEKKASVRKETNAVSGMRVTIMPKKPEHTAATLSEPSFSRGRSESKKRSIQGKSNHGASLSDNRAVNFHKTETGCKAGDKCLFPHDKVDEQPNQKPKKGYYTQKRRESDDKNAVAIVKIVPQFVCVLQDSNALVAQRGKQFRRNPMQKGLGSSRKVRFTQFYATSSKYPGKERTIAWKNTSQTSTSAKSFEARLGTLPKTFTSSKKGQSYILLTLEPEKREFVVDSIASMHMVSKRDLDSTELETMRISRSPVQTREEATVHVKELDSFVTVTLREEIPAVPSLGKLCEYHGYTYHWTSGQKLTSHQKGQENRLQHIQLCTIRGSWFISEFFPNYTFTYFFVIFVKGFPSHLMNFQWGREQKWNRFRVSTV